MLRKIFPTQIDNRFSGLKSGLWLFVVVLLLKFWVALYALLNGNDMAVHGDSLPLDTFSPVERQIVVSLYSLWGLEHMMICLISLVVLIRYRSMISFMFIIFLVEQSCRKFLVLHFLPLPSNQLTGESPGLSPVPYGFLVMIITGLLLSISGRARQKIKPSGV